MLIGGSEQEETDRVAVVDLRRDADPDRDQVVDRERMQDWSLVGPDHELPGTLFCKYFEPEAGLAQQAADAEVRFGCRGRVHAL